MLPSRRDGGFTLIEVLVTIGLASMLMAMAVVGWRAWSQARAESETASELRTVLRNTQQRAITEGTAMCVSFSATSYTVWRGTCTSADVVDGPIAVEGTSQLSAPTFNQLNPAQSISTAVFTARGTASSGTVTITRPGSSTAYQVKVEGLTGRTYLCRNGDCDEA